MIEMLAVVALYWSSPAFVAMITQLPANKPVTTLPVTEQKPAEAGSTEKLIAPLPEPP